MSTSMDENQFAKIVVVKKNGSDGDALPLMDDLNEISFGRSDKSDVRINLNKVSRKHALVTISEIGEIFIRNLSKVNETYVNKKPIKKENMKLQNGDSFSIGDRIFRVEYEPMFLQALEQYKKEMNTEDISGEQDSVITHTPQRPTSSSNVQLEDDEQNIENENQSEAKNNGAQVDEEITFSPRITPTKRSSMGQQDGEDSGKVSPSQILKAYGTPEQLSNSSARKSARKSSSKKKKKKKALPTPLRQQIQSKKSLKKSKKQQTPSKKEIESIDIDLDLDEMEAEQSEPVAQPQQQQQQAINRPTSMPTPVRRAIHSLRWSGDAHDFAQMQQPEVFDEPDQKIDAYEASIGRQFSEPDVESDSEYVTAPSTPNATHKAAAAANTNVARKLPTPVRQAIHKNRRQSTEPIVEQEQEEEEQEQEQEYEVDWEKDQEQAWDEDDWEQDDDDWVEPARMTIPTPLRREIKAAGAPKQHIFYGDSSDDEQDDNESVTGRQHIFFADEEEDEEWYDEDDSCAVRHDRVHALVTPARNKILQRRQWVGDQEPEESDFTEDSDEEDAADMVFQLVAKAHPTPIRNSVRDRRLTWNSQPGDSEDWSSDEEEESASEAEPEQQPEQQQHKTPEQIQEIKRQRRLNTPLQNAIKSKKNALKKSRKRLATPMRKAIEGFDASAGLKQRRSKQQVMQESIAAAKANKNGTPSSAKKNKRKNKNRKLATPMRKEIENILSNKTRLRKVARKSAEKKKARQEERINYGNRTPIKEVVEKKRSTQQSELTSPSFKEQLEQRRKSIRGRKNTPQKNTMAMDSDDIAANEKSVPRSMPTPLREELTNVFSSRKRKVDEISQEETDLEQETSVEQSPVKKAISFDDIEEQGSASKKARVNPPTIVIEAEEEIVEDDVEEEDVEEIEQEPVEEAVEEAVEEEEVVEVEEEESVDYESWSYADLRKECKSRGLKAAGKKADFIKRLMEDDQQDDDEEEEQLEQVEQEAVEIEQVEAEEAEEAEESEESEDEAEDEEQESVDYESWSYADLRKECKSRGLKAAGKKADFVKRLVEFDAENQDGEQEAEQQEEEIVEIESTAEETEQEESSEEVDYESWSYGDLRSECKTRGLKASGKKTDFIKRLIESDAEQSSSNTDNIDEDEQESEDEQEEEQEVDLFKLTNAVLRDMLESRGLDTAGKKADLVARLQGESNGPASPSRKRRSRSRNMTEEEQQTMEEEKVKQEPPRRKRRTRRG